MSLTVRTKFFKYNFRVTTLQRKRINTLKNLHFKLVRTHQALIYLQRCKRYGLFPKSFKLRIPFSTQKKQVLKEKIGALLLQQRIEDLHHHLAALKKQEQHQRLLVKDCLRDSDFTNVWLWILHVEFEEFVRVRERHLKKFNSLLLFSDQCTEENVYEGSAAGKTRPNRVVNLSSYQLDPNELKLLNKGLSYTLNGNPVSDINFVTRMEAKASHFKDEVEVIKEVENNIQQGKNKESKKKYSCDRRALRSLLDNEQIVVLEADKGGATVVMDKVDYLSKCNDLFEGGDYVQLLEDPTSEVEHDIITTVRRYIRQHGLDSKILFDLLKCNRIAIMYCWPKLHKDNIPMRPIISTCGTMTGCLASFLLPILKPLTRFYSYLHTNVKNSREAADRIKRDASFSRGLLVSFDVKNLFGSLPTNGVLDLLEDLLYRDHELSERTTLPVPKLLNLVKICIQNNYFIFNKEFYLQVHGIAMGSPLSPLLADLYLLEFEDKLFKDKSCLLTNKWLRYVDDTLSTWDHTRGELDNFLGWLNNRDEYLQFTIEIEEDKAIPFLDLYIRKVEDQTGSLNVEISMYQKPSCVGVCTNFESHQPLSIKCGIIKNYVNRITVCSDKKSEDIVSLKTKLQENGYPKNLVNNIVDNYHLKENNNKDKFYRISLPYEKGISDKLKTPLNHPQKKVIFKKGNPIGHKLARNYKDKGLCKLENGGVVYQVNCLNCKQMYIGETGRPIEVRINEHKGHVKKVLKDSSLNTCNGIANHVKMTGHQINWENIKILARERNESERKIKEALFIKSQNQGLLMNLNTGVRILGTWAGVLNGLNKKLNSD